MTKAAKATPQRPAVIDLRDRVDADVRAVCLRALHELATTETVDEQLSARAG